MSGGAVRSACMVTTHISKKASTDRIRWNNNVANARKKTDNVYKRQKSLITIALVPIASTAVYLMASESKEEIHL